MQAAVRKARSGELINETYELKERLETGSLCETYRATERGSGRAFRIKLLRPELALQSGAVDAFLRAPRTLHALRHPNLAPVIAIDTDATGIPFVVEESMEGEPLSRTLARFPQGMPYEAAIAMIAPLVDALAFAHARGVVHGQLDREHVVVTMVDKRAVPKLRAGAEESGSPGRAGSADDRVRADVRALGGLLHEVLFGRPPVRNRASIPGDRAAQLPPALVSLVEECLNQRITTAEGVRDALQAACAPKQRSSVPNGRLASGRPATAKAASARPERAEPAAAAAKPAPAQPLGSRPGPAKVVAPAPERADREVVDPVQLGLQATLIAERPSVPAVDRPSSPERRSSPAATVANRPRRSDVPEPFPIAESRAPNPDEVATVADAGAAGRESETAPVEIKTLSDVAAAFGPIDGADRIGQADVEPSDPPRLPPPATGRDRTSAPVVDRKPAATLDRRAPAPLSRKQLREGVKPVARALGEEQLRALRERAAEPESRWSRLISTLLFLLFAIGLVFVVPLLCAPGKAEALLGERARLAMAGFAALSVFALIRTWALQIHARPMLLRPVTLSLKLVTACTCVLAAGFFMPDGMLGPAAKAARWMLPWGAGGFYLFLAMYGLTRQLREAAEQPVRAIAAALLYCTALLGGHRVLATTVFDKGIAAAHARERADGGSVKDKVRTLRAVASGKPVAAAGAGAEAVQGAATALQEDDVAQRKEVGASEADDMTAVDALDGARKKKASALEDLRGTLQKVSR